ncbi:MAG: hypothetical protein NVS4B3_02500 [Gemmatimonadaceae bacterium]
MGVRGERAIESHVQLLPKEGEHLLILPPCVSLVRRGRVAAVPKELSRPPCPDEVRKRFIEHSLACCVERVVGQFVNNRVRETERVFGERR